MSAKNLDKKNRWRSVTVAFRVSPEEAYRLNMVARTSGLTKQDYILKQLLKEEVIVHPNCRVQKILSIIIIKSQKQNYTKTSVLANRFRDNTAQSNASLS